MNEIMTLPSVFYIVTPAAIYQSMTHTFDGKYLARIVGIVEVDPDAPPQEIVSLFLTFGIAQACGSTEHLRPADERWRDYTKATLQVLRTINPGLPISDFEDLKKVPPTQWIKFQPEGFSHLD
jgi:hypothetical protein